MFSFENNILGSVKQALSVFGEHVYIQALVVVAVSLIGAKLADWIITRGFTRITTRTRSDLDDRLIALLHRPIFNTVLLVGLLIAVLLVGPNESLRWFCRNLIASLVVFLWIVFGVRASTLVIASISTDNRRFKALQPTTRPLFETATKLILIALGIYFILISWGVDPVGWLATAGIAAVAVGLAAQETLGNLFSGISILADAPYKLGDFIVLEGQQRGKVTKIGLRSTRILTRDDLEVTIPNSIIARSRIVNETGGRWTKQRLRIPVGVAYGSDVEVVRRLLLSIATEQKNVCKHPEAWVKFGGFGESSLNFEIRCWFEDPAMRGRITDALNTGIDNAFREHRIEIPYPKRDVYIKELPEGVLSKTNRDT